MFETKQKYQNLFFYLIILFMISFQKMKQVLFRAAVTSDRISWIVNQMMQTTMKDIAAMVWQEPKGVEAFPIKSSTRAFYDCIDYVKATKSIEAKFNLTDRIDVMKGGIVSLLNASVVLTSSRNVEGNYEDWALSASGKEVILGEAFSDISISLHVNLSSKKFSASTELELV